MGGERERERIKSDLCLASYLAIPQPGIRSEQRTPLTFAL